MGVDFVSNPDRLEKPEYAVKSAIHYWRSRGLDKIAARSASMGHPKAVKAITKRINGGYNHLAERRQAFVRGAPELGIDLKRTSMLTSRTSLAGAGIIGGTGLSYLSDVRMAVEDGQGIMEALGIDPVSGLLAVAVIGLGGWVIYDRWWKAKHEFV